MIRANPHIAAMAPYALATLSVPEGQRLISLSQNESLRPPSPQAVHAARVALDSGQLYPDPDWTELRAALSNAHHVAADGILCGAGSLELIAALMRAYAGPERPVVMPRHAYPFFATAARMADARLDTAPETAFKVDVDALLAAATPHTALVAVANPGNPTGTRIANAELRRLRDGLPRDTLLLIDEAYGEFSDGAEPPLFDLVGRGDTVITRSLSKAYGLAGFRVGWGLFPAAIAAELRKVLNPNNISMASQAAATAAVIDQAYMRETCTVTATLRDCAVARLRSMGVTVPDSHTNFCLIDLGCAARAGAADMALRRQGVFLRPQGGAGLPACLRLTIAAAPALDAALDALEAWIGEDGR